MKNKYMSRLAQFNEKSLRFSKKGTAGFFANLVTCVMMISLCVIFLIPFFYLLSHSVMSAQDLADGSVEWIPRSYIFENFTFAMRLLNYFPRLFYSLGVTAAAVFTQVLSCAFVAYGLARIRFRGNGLIFALIIFTMIIPTQALIVTQYLLYSRLGLLNTMLPMILPCLFASGLNGGLFCFLFRQFFKGIPVELESAAYIDGLGVVKTFFKIMLPNSGAPILVTSILSCIWQWNNYFEPSIYITEPSRYTLTMMLSNLSKTASQMNMGGFTSGVNLAATALCALPVILLFFILQKRFIKGTESSGLAN